MHASDSTEQQSAEEYILSELNRLEDCVLKPERRPLPDGGYVQLDGYDDESGIVCEIYARVGKLKGSQPDKLASDFLKISKENMGIKLTTLTRAVLQAQEGSNELFTSTQQFNRAYDQFQEFKTILHAKSDLLRKHDETMR